MREVSSAEVERYVARWAEEPPLAVVVRAACGVRPAEAAETQGEMQLPMQTELSQAEYDDLVARMKANAEAFGRRRN